MTTHTCLECGAPSSPHADFCKAACRKAWHNRRAMRGLAIYDLIMALRFDRATATALGVWKAINRLAAAFRDEDQTKRQGRRSWSLPHDVFNRLPWLRNDVILRAPSPSKSRKGQ